MFMDYRKIGVYFAIVLLVTGIFFLGFYSRGLNHNEDSENNFKETNMPEKMVKIKVVAVDNNGKGVTSDLVTELRPGQGLVLVNINNILADINTQYSARIAALVAKNYTKMDLSNTDIIFNIKTNANVVGGQSAGSTMAVSVIGALLNKTLREDILMTGSILEDGRIGEAGSIREKAIAARESNATLFLVPEGAATELGTTKRTKTCAEYEDKTYCEINYVEDKLNLGENLGINIKEVSTIGEAVGYYF